MRRKLPQVIVLTVIAVVCSTATASAALEDRGSRAAAPSSLASLDLSNLGAIKAHLRSLGMDPEQFVIQRGRQNYAGPACPGEGWTCTTSANVVQVTSVRSLAADTSAMRSDDDPENRAVCATGEDDDDARLPGTDADQPPPLEPPPLIECTIVQLAPSGDALNIATCIQVTSEPGIRGLCDITQENVHGSNVTRVRQSFTQSQLAVPPVFFLVSQYGQQTSTIKQTNEIGKNRAVVEQRIRQRVGFDLDPGSSPCCIQTAAQASALDQRNIGGENTGQINQRYSQNLASLASVAGDFQCGDATSTHTQLGGSGRQVLKLDESYSQEMEAPNTTSGLQVQQAKDSNCLFFEFLPNLGGAIVQDSTGISNAEVTQRGVQRLSAGPGVTQLQDDPFDCCATQTGNPANRARIDQRLSQFGTGTPDLLFQGAALKGHCTTSGHCTVGEQLNQNGVITQRSGSGAFVDISIDISLPPCAPFCLFPA